MRHERGKGGLVSEMRRSQLGSLPLLARALTWRAGSAINRNQGFGPPHPLRLRYSHFNAQKPESALTSELKFSPPKCGHVDGGSAGMGSRGWERESRGAARTPTSSVAAALLPTRTCRMKPVQRESPLLLCVGA